AAGISVADRGNASGGQQDVNGFQEPPEGNYDFGVFTYKKVHPDASSDHEKKREAPFCYDDVLHYSASEPRWAGYQGIIPGVSLSHLYFFSSSTVHTSRL